MHKLSRRQTLASVLAAGASTAVPSTRAAHADGTTACVSFLLVNDIYRIEEKDGRARTAGADLVIAIVHADKATGSALMNTHAVDLVLSGHNHDLHIDFDGRSPRRVRAGRKLCHDRRH
jgi:hypothetical protein